MNQEALQLEALQAKVDAMSLHLRPVLPAQTSKMNQEALQLEALQAKVDIMSAKLDFLFDKEIGSHFAWEIVDNKVVISGRRNLVEEKREAKRACLAAAGLL